MGDVKRTLVLTKAEATIPRKPKVTMQIADADLVLVITDTDYRVLKDRNGRTRTVDAAEARRLLGQTSD